MNGVLSLKQFNRIRAMAIKGNESKKNSNRTNAKSQLSVIHKENEEEVEERASKTFKMNDSKRLQSHIPTFTRNTKVKETLPKLTKNEGKINKKKLANLSPSLIHSRNKNNKLSKIPYRKVQTFEDDETKEATESDSPETNNAKDKNEYNNYDKEFANDNEQFTSNIKEELSDEKEINSNKKDDEFDKAVIEFNNQKDNLDQIEKLNTIPFNISKYNYSNEDQQYEGNTSQYRNKILKLEYEIESLRSRRKKELSVFHEKSLEIKNAHNEKTQLLINNDDVFIESLQRELMKYDQESLIFS